MKTKPLTFVLLVVGLLAACGPLLAHHGNSALNTDRVIVIKNATVAKLVWANPHCIVAFDATDEKGNVVRWAAEVGSPSAMNQMGWSRNSLKPGDVITRFSCSKPRPGAIPSDASTKSCWPTAPRCGTALWDAISKRQMRLPTKGLSAC